MEVREKMKMVEVYEVNGKEFYSKIDAYKYKRRCENELEREYYVVEYRPLLCGGYDGKVILGVEGEQGLSTVYQYLVEEYGLPLYYLEGKVGKMYNIGKSNRFREVCEMEKFFERETRRNKEVSIVYLSECGKVEQEVIYE